MASNSSRARSRPRGSSDAAPLSRDAWLDAAAGAVAEGGFDSVRILALAKKLGVTRGSFYWHFQDHAEFIGAFLTRWRDRRIAELDSWRPAGENFEEELRRITHFLLSEPARNLKRLKVELAVREYARRDALAARLVVEVDRARLAQARLLLGNTTDDENEARDLAALLYATTTGSQLLLAGPAGDERTPLRLAELVADMILERGKRRDRKR